MIAYIEGTLLEKNPETAVVKTGGIGYRIEIPLTTFYSLPSRGESVTLHIQTVVREDSIRLFGFRNEEERQLFGLLLTISRIGPKLALNILSGMEFEPLRQAIIREDTATLASIPGLGKKSAERMLFELQGKADFMRTLGDTQTGSGEFIQEPQIHQVVSALTNLGYKEVNAEKAAKKAFSEGGSDTDLQSVIRRALFHLSGRKQ
jgi:holliday junction DNA helicase RuvA